MKRDLLWTLGGIALAATAIGVLLPGSEPNLVARTAPVSESVPGRAASSNTAPATGLSPHSASTAPARPAVVRSAVHWSAAPYATAGDAYAVVFQPRATAASERFTVLESLVGELLPRDVAERTEWIVAYGRRTEQELELTQNLTFVVKHVEPTTAIDVAADRFAGRELTDLVHGEWSGVRVAPAAETVLIERADDQGNYREVESTLEHEAMAVIEHDPQTYLIVPERRLPEVLDTPAPSAVADRLAALDPKAACGFVTADGEASILTLLARTGGDRSALALQPVLILLKNASSVSIAAGLDSPALVDARIGFADAAESTRIEKAVNSLKTQTLALLDDLASGTGATPALHTGRRLLNNTELSTDGTALRVRLPRPDDLRTLLAPEQLSSR